MKFKNILLVLSSLALTVQLPAEALDLMSCQWRGSALKKTTSEVKNGEFSFRWDAYERSSVRVDRFTTQDWTAFSGLSVWVYSEEITDANIALAVYGESENTDQGTGISYYVYRFTVDWEGWKQINISFEDFTQVRDRLGWADVSYIKIMNYYNASPVAGTVLYFNDLKLVE